MTVWAALVRMAAPELRRFSLGILLTTLTIGASVALMGTSAWLIATAALHPSIAALQVAVVGVRFFGLARGVGRYLERLVTHDVTLRLLGALRVRVFERLAPRVPAIWDRRSTGDTLTRLLADVETVEHAYLRVAGPIAAAVLVTTAVTVVLSAIAPRAGLVVFTGLVLAATLAPLLSWRMGRRAGTTQIAARAALHAHLVDGVQGAADLLAFGAADAQLSRLDEASRALAGAERRTSQASALGAVTVSVLADVTAIAVIVSLAPLVASGEVSGVLMTVATLLALASFESVAPLPLTWQTLPATYAAAQRVLDADGSTASPSASSRDSRMEQITFMEPSPQPAAPATSSVEVNALTFSYPDTATPALRDVSLTLSPGRLVALVGESGSGKSTLVQLLLKLRAVPDGAIRLNGQDVAALDAGLVRRHFAWMSQRADIFTGTLADNLRLGRSDATNEDLDAAIARAGLGDAVARWPEGRETWIGEQGATLSGGERQRLALARVLLKDAPIILLDEPASQVDAATEVLILDECVALARDRAVLLITHRVAGLARADEILVLSRGTIVERGAFEALVRSGGIFQRVLDQQSQ